jgi:hypothetical protein
MDYTVYRDANKLGSTGFIEIGVGNYSGRHWQEGFLFVWEDAFTIAEGIVARHHASYDHCGMNDIPRESGLAIAKDLRSAAAAVPTIDGPDAIRLLALPRWLIESFLREFPEQRFQMQALLEAIASTLEQAYVAEDYACILGV